MNCAEWEEKTSLYAGGDLPAAEAAAVEAHVADCAGCQVFLSGLRQSMELLRDAHGDAVEPAHFAAVRARVMARLEAARVPWWRRTWVYGLAFAAAALIVAVSVAVALWPGPAPAPPALAVYRAPAPQVTRAPESGPEEPAAAVAPVRHRRREARPAAPRKSEPVEPLVVKLVTDNPDVVIYWIADRRGE